MKYYTQLGKSRSKNAENSEKKAKICSKLKLVIFDLHIKSILASVRVSMCVYGCMGVCEHLSWFEVVLKWRGEPLATGSVMKLPPLSVK